MHLKELEIFGFKSFPEKTSLRFEPGITIVVGPNGCGKSNILDSIKWALGEQSPKSLRGTKMEDIIFNGTEHHPALNYAEVTLTFCNEDNYLPIEYKEVSIGRRLYRSGESEYYLNKNLVRLKDIGDLFMGTGVGESTYSFIEQGKIELFLSYKPEDKRLIFDEASGIVKYKDRRKETLKRLEETDENLIRLEDIISEVGRQTRYLERQVDKARQYKEVQERLVETEKKIANLQLADLNKQSGQLDSQLCAFNQDEDLKLKNLETVKSSQDNFGEALGILRKNLEEANSVVVTLGANIKNAASHIEVCRQRIKELEDRLIVLENTKNEFNERLLLQDNRIEEENKQFTVIDDNLKLIEQQVTGLAHEKEGLRNEIQEATERIEEQKLKIFEFEGSKVGLHNSLIENQANLATFLKRKQRLFLDKARIEGLLKEKESNLGRLKTDLQVLSGKLSDLKNKRSLLLLKEKDLSNHKENLRSQIINSEKELVEFSSYFEFLQDFRTKFDTFSVSKNITVYFEEEPANINKLVATIKGASIEREGNLYKARVEAKVISLEENQLQEKINLLKVKIEDIKTNLRMIEEESQKITQEVSAENQQLEEEEKKWQQKSLQVDALNSEWQRLQEEFKLTEDETATTLESIMSLENKNKETDGQLNLVETGLAQAKSIMDTSIGVIAKNSERVNEIDVDTARREAQKLSLVREKESLHSKIALLEDEKKNILKNMEGLLQENNESKTKIESSAKQIQLLEEKIKEDSENIKEHSGRKIKLEEEESNLANNLEEQRKLQQDIEKSLEEIRSTIADKKMEIQSLDYEKNKVKDYLRQVYQVDLQEIPLDQIKEPLQDLCQDRDKLQKKRQSLGEVNLVAIEEFEELKKRQDFLAKQKEDLITSKENLKKAIAKINKISKELFLETFAKIEEEFKKNFRFLFNGGRAQLILIDQDNVLESGVEIEVQPPGKKLQNVSLLSGGEKSLTAIALIFAIFRVRPSPLCVLDEIDAPLDEANVDRFNNLLREFSSFSQFLLITHNKKTMSNADILYGVTMQEKGVSKLVSVKFATDKKPAKNASQNVSSDAGLAVAAIVSQDKSSQEAPS